METSGPIVRLLMRLGYWSVWHGLHTEASVLFAGAQAARPASEVPVVGMAVLAMAMNQPASAVNLLRGQAPAGNPPSDLVEAHLGCALCLAGEEAEGRGILSRLAAGAKDAATRQMAATLSALPTAQLSPSLPKVL
jgi:hypothetical protein